MAPTLPGTPKRLPVASPWCLTAWAPAFSPPGMPTHPGLTVALSRIPISVHLGLFPISLLKGKLTNPAWTLPRAQGLGVLPTESPGRNTQAFILLYYFTDQESRASVTPSCLPPPRRPLGWVRPQQPQGSALDTAQALLYPLHSQAQQRGHRDLQPHQSIQNTQ